MFRFFFQIYAVPRIEQQRKPSVKTLRSSLSAKFWRHGGIHHSKVQPGHQSEELYSF